MSSQPTRVLLVGIDGVRADALARSRTEHLDRLSARGGMKPLTIDERGLTVSGPSWSTILTGAWPVVHGVVNNEDPPPRRVSDVFSRLRTAGIVHLPVAAASWPPLTRRVGCGPIIDPDAVRTFTAPPVTGRVEQYAAADAAVCQAAIEFLSVERVDAAFVHFDLADAVAHRHGVGAAYYAAIRQVDVHLGAVLRALDGRPDRESWTAIVTTDHGHVDAGGHGGRSEQERSSWVASDRETVLRSIASIADIAPAIEREYREDARFSVR